MKIVYVDITKFMTKYFKDITKAEVKCRNEEKPLFVSNVTLETLNNYEVILTRKNGQKIKINTNEQ